MISEEQRLKRMHHLGSTDLAAILGEDPWRNAYDVWLEKTGRYIPKDLSNNKSLETGTFIEVGILDWAETKLGKLKRYNNENEKDNIEIVIPGFPIVDHPDAIVINNNIPVEAKTAGLMGPLSEDYGEGLDELPIRVVIQCHVHMLALGASICYVPVLLGGIGFKMYEIKKIDWLLETIMDSSIKFWDDYVLADSPPPNIVPTGDYIKRVKRVPKKSIKIKHQIVKNWLSAKESLKHAEAIANEAKNALLAELGDAEVGIYPGGMVTYYSQKSITIDSGKLKDEEPEIAEKYSKVNIFRILRNRIEKPKVKFEINNIIE